MHIDRANVAGRRYKQLVRAAARVVEEEGVEALKPARVAELAGCTRPLIYRYFPHRSDLYIGITEDFYAALDERLSKTAQQRALRHIAHADREQSLAFFDAFWDAVEEKGCAGLMLRCSTDRGPEQTLYLKEVRQRFEKRWYDTLSSLGMSDVEAEFAFESGLGLAKALMQLQLADRITRAEVRDMHFRALTKLLQSLMST